MLVPSTTLPPLTLDADPKVYHKIGSKIKRGEPGHVMSNSSLKEFAKCPSRWHLGSPKEESDSLLWGSLIDCIILTPDRFNSTFAICPEEYPAEGKKKGDPIEMRPWNMNANFCKTWQMDRELEGLTVVKPKMAADAWLASQRIGLEPHLSAFLQASSKQVQLQVEYHDEDTDVTVPIKCLVDLAPGRLTGFRKSLGDLKTVKSAIPHEWTTHVYSYGYHIQAALYLDAWNAVTGEKRDTFYHLIQENFAPYETARRILSDEFVTLGRVEYLNALRSYCKCVKSGVWPGYDDMETLYPRIDGWSVVDPLPYMMTA